MVKHNKILLYLYKYKNTLGFTSFLTLWYRRPISFSLKSMKSMNQKPLCDLTNSHNCLILALFIKYLFIYGTLLMDLLFTYGDWSWWCIVLDKWLSIWKICHGKKHYIRQFKYVEIWNLHTFHINRAGKCGNKHLQYMKAGFLKFQK